MSTRLTDIRITGLKGAPGTPVQLDQVTFLHGPNAAGKSTVLDGVVLLVLGYHPTAGRGGMAAIRNDDVLRLASGDLLEVRGTFACDGQTWTFTRRWERFEVRRGKEKGTLKTTTSLDALDPRGWQISGEDAKAELHRIVGEAWGLDLGQLLGPDVTDSKRRAMLLDAGGRRSTWPPERVHAALDKLGLLGCLLGEPWQGAEQDGPLADWLTKQWEHAKEETSRVRLLAATRREAITGIQEDAEPIDPKRVGQLRQEHEMKQTAARQLADRAARAEEATQQELDRALEAQERRNRLDGELQQVRADILRAEQAAPQTSGLKASIENLVEGFGDDALPSLQAAVQRAQETVLAAEQGAQETGESRQWIENDRQAVVAAAEGRLQQLRQRHTAAADQAQTEITAAEQRWQDALRLLQQQRQQGDEAVKRQQAAAADLRQAQQGLEFNVQRATEDQRRVLREQELVAAQNATPLVQKLREALEWEEFCPACSALVRKALAEVNVDLGAEQKVEQLRTELVLRFAPNVSRAGFSLHAA